MSPWRIALAERFWQARHPPRYAAFNTPSSPNLPHSSVAEDNHIFDEQKRDGWKGILEFLDPGLANRLLGSASPETRTKDDAVSATAPSTSSDDDRPPPVDMTDPRRQPQNPLKHDTTFGGMDSLSSGEAMIARGTQAGLEAAIRNLLATGTTNGAAAAGGLINASYETGDGVVVSGGAARMGSRSGALPSLRYGRDAAGHYRFTPGADGPVDHFTAAGRTFASKSPDLMRRMMKDFNLGPEQAAVIMGNLGHESRGFTTFHEGGLPWEKGGIGWAQWTGSRRRQYEAWTAANKLDPRSDEANYGFLKHEIMTNPRYKAALDRLRASKGTPEDLMAFEKVFEGAGVKAYGSRWAYDRKALKALEDSEHNIAGREPQGPRLPQRAPREVSPEHGQITAMADVPMINLANFREARDIVHEIHHGLSNLHEPSVSVSVVHGQRGGGGNQLASRSDVGRHARGVPSTSGSTFV